jgi:F-type H+-transporting ATPase subunit gamma
MSHRQNLERHRHSLAEIRGIMNSMKSLAYMETRKLARLLDAQHAVVEGIEAVAADLLSFHSGLLPQSREHQPLYLLIGSERGFCGDFNHRLMRQLESTLQAHPCDRATLVAVGHKLHLLFEANTFEATLVDGVSVVDETTNLLNQLLNLLTQLQQKRGIDTLYCLYHKGEANIELRRLLPPFEAFTRQPGIFPHPPILHQPPAEFLLALTEQYLFAALHEIIFDSLMAENQQRVTHLEGAVRHLDDEATKLAHQCNTLRQEEIIEEIEVILLSAMTPDKKAMKHDV